MMKVKVGTKKVVLTAHLKTSPKKKFTKKDTEGAFLLNLYVIHTICTIVIVDTVDTVNTVSNMDLRVGGSSSNI